MSDEPKAEAAGGPRPNNAPEETAQEKRTDAPGEILREVRAVVLDMGGVILDLGEAKGLPWGELDRRGREALLELLGKGGGEAGEEELDAWLFDPWRREYDRRYRTGREARWEPHLARLRRLAGTETPPMRLLETLAQPYLAGLRAISGAQAALARLAAADLRLALVSNVPMPGRFYREVLEREEMAELFRVLLFSYDQGARKPGPVLVQRALDALEVEPEEAVMVGDRRSTDIHAGRAAGVATVWVESADTDGPEPDAVIGSVVELPGLLGLDRQGEARTGSRPRTGGRGASPPGR